MPRHATRPSSLALLATLPSTCTSALSRYTRAPLLAVKPQVRFFCRKPLPALSISSPRRLSDSFLHPRYHSLSSPADLASHHRCYPLPPTMSDLGCTDLREERVLPFLQLLNPEKLAIVGCTDRLGKNRALEFPIREMSEESGTGATSKYNNDDQIDDLLQSIEKIRDEMLRKESILQERSAQCDMDIQTLLREGKMTPKAVSIISKYKETCSDINSSCSRDGGQPITERKKLREALLRQCKELDNICRGAHWILPRYTVLPSVSDGMYHASVRLRCPDFEISLTGGPRPTPREAKCSAAANMILELHKKAEEQEH